MALKNVRRVTFSLPKATIKKLEIAIPKSKRSKFIAEQIEKGLAGMEKVTTVEDIDKFWGDFNKKYPFLEPMDQSVVEMIRKDRMSH